MKCCLCKSKIKADLNGWKGGHNPFPLKDEGRCCENCNNELVIPSRLTITLGISAKESRKLTKEINNVNENTI